MGLVSALYSSLQGDKLTSKFVWLIVILPTNINISLNLSECILKYDLTKILKSEKKSKLAINQSILSTSCR